MDIAAAELLEKWDTMVVEWRKLAPCVDRDEPRRILCQCHVVLGECDSMRTALVEHIGRMGVAIPSGAAAT